MFLSHEKREKTTTKKIEGRHVAVVVVVVGRLISHLSISLCSQSLLQSGQGAAAACQETPRTRPHQPWRPRPPLRHLSASPWAPWVGLCVSFLRYSPQLSGFYLCHRLDLLRGGLVVQRLLVSRWTHANLKLIYIKCQSGDFDAWRLHITRLHMLGFYDPHIHPPDLLPTSCLMSTLKFNRWTPSHWSKHSARSHVVKAN